MRESMARLTPVFSANRAVREYTEQHYAPAAKAYLDRMRDGGEHIVSWRSQVEEHWNQIHFGSFHIHTNGGQHTFTVEVDLAGLNPDFVRVELFADGAGAAPMSRNGNSYCRTIATERPAADFTPRIVPCYPAATVPLECPKILWYR